MMGLVCSTTIGEEVEPVPQHKKHLPPSGFKTMRDVLSFLLGSVILVYAIVVAQPPPSEISVLVGLTLIGIPATSLMGGKKNGNNSEGS